MPGSSEILNEDFSEKNNPHDEQSGSSSEISYKLTLKMLYF